MAAAAVVAVSSASATMAQAQSINTGGRSAAEAALAIPGPIFAGASVSRAGHRRFYLSVGRLIR